MAAQQPARKLTPEEDHAAVLRESLSDLFESTITWKTIRP